MPYYHLQKFCTLSALVQMTTNKGNHRHLELSSGSLEHLVAETISWAAKNNNRELESFPPRSVKDTRGKMQNSMAKVCLSLAELWRLTKEPSNSSCEEKSKKAKGAE
ncbi:2247_t:CDS:2 [Ambispora leptoticha]|uniref:2247_t:CDS:1 n=1 Tax=Ambispora leptoticha TaxID=144679 RepID=A0A9N8ZDJ8_9GLOM|nr:2247_t:CDS:2 [Ambispora leptoticha]